MKTTAVNLSRFISALFLSLLSLLAYNARATVYYWDPEGNWGSTATYTNGSLAGTWENTLWNTSYTGANAQVAWSESSVAACFAVGAGAYVTNGVTNTTTFTVTMNANHTVAGFFIGALNPDSGIVTLNGTGTITIPSGLQGFDIINSSDGSLGQLIINNVMAGTGTPTAEGNGQLFFNGVNTYTGGTYLGWSGGSWSGILNFNNSASFGTGTITMTNGSGSALVAEGSSAITIPNAFRFLQASQNLNLVGNSAGVTFSGNWALNGAKVGLGSGGSGNLVTISGVISGTGSINKYNPSTLALTGANTYTGGTTNSAGILSVNTIADANCSIGPSGTFTMNGGTLQYTGASAATTTRQFSGTSGSTSTIDLPAGNLSLNGRVTAATSGLFTVVKTSSGTLTFGGTAADNSYVAVNVNGGTLVLAKASSGSVHAIGSSSTVNNGGTLKLAGTGGDQIYTGVTLTVNSGGTFDMGGVNEGLAMLAGSGLVTNSGSSTSTLQLGEGNTGGTFSGQIVDGSSGQIALTKTGTNTLTLNGANTYSGATAINNGTLALGASGSLSSGSSISLAAGATFDVSALGASSTYTLGGATFTATGTTNAATIKGGATGAVNLGSLPVVLNFDGTHTPLVVSQGTLQLSGNTITVNNTGSALAAGTYTLISQSSGNILASGPLTLNLAGNKIAPGNAAYLTVSGGSVNLVVVPVVFSNLTASQTIQYGTASVMLSGTVSASGVLYPALGETITVTINGNPESTTTTDTNGDFAFVYTTSTLPASGTAYAISYSYTGDATLGGTTNATTSLTVNPAPLTVTAGNSTKTYGQTVAFGSGSANFTSVGLLNGETIGSVTLNDNGNGGVSNAPVSGSPYTITPSAATGGTFNPANYAITYGNGTLTVNPASLTVTAANQAKAFGQTLTVGSGNTNFLSSGLQNSETIGSVTIAVSGGGDAASASVAGSPYTITPSAATGGTFDPANYSITYSPGTLTVTSASLSITANNQTKTYGQTLTFGSGSTNFTATGLANGDTVGSVTLAVSGGDVANAPVSGSPYTITPSAATGGTFNPTNYSLVYNTGTLTINPASLTVTADSFSRVYGTTNPVFTVTYTNFANGETLATSDVIGSPALTTAADTNSDVGAYVITNSTGTLASSNYTFSLVNGTLTVTNAASTNVLTASTNPALPGTAVVFTATLSTLAPSAAVPTNLVQFLIDGTNYNLVAYPTNGMAIITNSALSHGYHVIEADYAGDTNAAGDTNILGSTNTLSELINTPPVAGPAAYSRLLGATLQIAIGNLLTNATDADSDALSLVSVSALSTNGATVATNGGFVTYTPPATNGNVADAFTYTVQDTFGATSSSTVTITIQSENNSPPVNISGLTTLANGTISLNFSGVPNYTYLIETTTNLTPPITWIVLSTNVADTNGLFNYTDLDATNHPVRYYRTSTP